MQRADVQYTPIPCSHLWKIEITTNLYRHVGYVWADEAGLLSDKIYSDLESAAIALNDHVRKLG